MRANSQNVPRKAPKVQLLFFFYFLLIAAPSVFGVPVTSESSTEADATTTENADTNATDLYVIRAIVYEVGILTEPDNTTDESEESHEQVDLTFFDPQHNGSRIDLSNIPVPLQTNVSGQVVTGLAPVNLGSLQLPTAQAAPVYSPANANLTAYALPNAIVSVTTNVSTTNPDTSSSILQGLPPLLGLPQAFNASGAAGH